MTEPVDLYPLCANVTTDEECLAIYRPPTRHDLAFTLTMTVTYSLLGLLGIFGNVLVIAVVARLKSMRSGPNLYLLNLAVADFMLILTGMPLELHEYWFAYPHLGGDVLGPFLCIFRHWASEVCAYASVLTICAFTVERAMTVQCSSLLTSSHSQANVRRVSVAIFIIWLLAGSFAGLVSYQWRIQYVVRNGHELKESAICIPLEELNSPVLFIVPVVFFFFVPMGLITILYLLIWRAIKRVSNLLRIGFFDSVTTSHYCASTISHHPPQHSQQMGSIRNGGGHHGTLRKQASVVSNNNVIGSNNIGQVDAKQDKRSTAVIKVQSM